MFELRDTIRRLDAETDYKYDLVGMYEATELSESEKKLIATMIADAKDPEEIAGELFKIFNTQNAMNMDEDCGNTLTEDVEEELDEALNENIKTLDDFLQDAEVILVDDAETFDINEWEGKNAAEMSEELQDDVSVKSESKFIKYKLEDADVDKVVEKIKNSSINIVDYWKTKQFLKKRGLDKSDLDEAIHNLSKEDYKTNSKSVDDAYNEAIIFIKNSRIKDLGPFNMYIKLDYDSVEENPVIVISIHETSIKQSNNELEEDTIKQDGKWVNKGKEGTHGEFATKKEADAQRKAMFANGYKEELNEAWKDFTFMVKCNDGPKEKISVVAENKSKAEEYAKKMYSQNHSVYADDRYNKWIIKEGVDDNNMNEALHGKNEIEQFVKMANQIGLKTMDDLKKFIEIEGDGKDILTALHDYLANEIGDINFQAKDECLNEDTQEDDQFNRAVDAMKAYWNYDLSLEQLHKLLLKIYNNDAEKAFTVFATYGDAARRNKDESLKESYQDIDTMSREELMDEIDSIYADALKGRHTDITAIIEDPEVFNSSDADEEEGYFKGVPTDKLRGVLKILRKMLSGGSMDKEDQKVLLAKNEPMKESVSEGKWEEVDSKQVEDSDGFLTDYVWYTDGDKHVFVFGDSDIYRPEDEDFDWEIDIVEGKEAEAYKEAQDWFDSYNGFADELNEAQDIYDIQGQAVRDSRRKEVLDEFKDIFGTGDNGEVNIDSKETLEYVRGYLEDQGYTITVSDSTNAEHPIHIEWFK